VWSAIAEKSYTLIQWYTVWLTECLLSKSTLTCLAIVFLASHCIGGVQARERQSYIIRMTDLDCASFEFASWPPYMLSCVHTYMMMNEGWMIRWLDDDGTRGWECERVRSGWQTGIITFVGETLTSFRYKVNDIECSFTWEKRFVCVLKGSTIFFIQRLYKLSWL